MIQTENNIEKNTDNQADRRKRYERPLASPIIPTMPGKSGNASAVSVKTDIDGVAIESLVAQYGSPLFIFSEELVRNNIRNAQRAFKTRYPSVTFAWSYKTNYLTKICKIFHEEGSWAEVVSGFEYQKALLNRCDPTHIIFNGPSKSDDDLKLAISHNSLIHIDNLQEFYRLAEIAETEKKVARVGVRINLDAGVYPHWNRFGFNYENGEAWNAILQVLANKHVSLEGIHCHIGTFVLSTEAYAKAAEKMTTLAVKLEKEHNNPLKYIDLGGGFASRNSLKGSYVNGEDLAPSFDDYAEAITAVLLKGEFTHRPMLVLETGRALIDDAGYLAATVLTSKRLPDGMTNVVIDAGVNLLFTSYWYNHKVSVVGESSHYVEEVYLTGPLCMNIDVIRERVALPPLSRGRLLLIHYVGAYNVTQWMQFIAYRPAVVMVNCDKHVSVLRKSETFDDVVRLEEE